MDKGVKARQPPSRFFFPSLVRGSPAGFLCCEECQGERWWLRGGPCCLLGLLGTMCGLSRGYHGAPGTSVDAGMSSLGRGVRCKTPRNGEIHFPGEGGGLLGNDARALDFEGTCIGVDTLGRDAGRRAQGALQGQPWLWEGVWPGRMGINRRDFCQSGE